MLDNFFPKSTGVSLRRGKSRYATFGDETLPVLSLFSYRNGVTEELFGANENTIYDLSSIPFPFPAEISDGGENVIGDGQGNVFGWASTDGFEVSEGHTDGNWSVIQFATTGGIYLVGVNGVDTGFIYDGDEFWPNVPGGFWYLPLTSETTPFVEGEAVTGGTSGATAVVYRDETAQLVIRDIVEQAEVWEIDYVEADEPFTVGSTLVGDTSNASAEITADTPGASTWNLAYDAGSAIFTVGETVTGGTSGATATVDAVNGDATSGTLTLSSLTGAFEDNEALTGSVSGAATANGAATELFNGTLTLGPVTGTFTANEPIRDGAGADADAVGGATYVTGGAFQAGETLTGDTAGDAIADGAQTSAAPGMDFGSLTSADMGFVWSYKNRLWFAQVGSLSAWYLDVDSIGGEATEFPMGGIFANGGSLMFGQRWSLESGGRGGLSDQNIFVTDQGEVAIYQGISPDEADTWSLVGVYRVGTPLGKRAYIRGGGDLAIATTVGLVPLSKAISLDVTALNVATVSYKIADAWTEAVTLRGERNWQAMIWPEEKMALIGLPDMVGSSDPVVFVTNSETGAWTRFTNWQALCMEVYRGQLYFGSPDGRVYQANVGGLDDDAAYTGAVVPLFDDLGSSAGGKVGEMAKARVRAVTELTGRVDMMADFDITLPAAPDATPIISSNEWGSAVWGTSTWGATRPTVINQDWRSVGGYGYSIAPAYQVTSGALAPLDAELIDFELTFSTAELVT